MRVRATANPDPWKRCRGVWLSSFLAPPAAGVRHVAAEGDAAVRAVGDPHVAGAVEGQIQKALAPIDVGRSAAVVHPRKPLESKARREHGLVVEESG